MKNIFIVNGPNFSHLHLRELEQYKGISLKDIEALCTSAYSSIFTLSFFQSNNEGDIIDSTLTRLSAFDALIINPAALTHYSLALADTLAIVKANKKAIVEVHLTNVFSRSEERHTLITTKHADTAIFGAGINSYLLALHYLKLVYSL